MNISGDCLRVHKGAPMRTINLQEPFFLITFTPPTWILSWKMLLVKLLLCDTGFMLKSACVNLHCDINTMHRSISKKDRWLFLLCHEIWNKPSVSDRRFLWQTSAPRTTDDILQKPECQMFFFACITSLLFCGHW